MSIAPPDEAAAIMRHYIRTLAERSGLRWTEANDRDFDRLADLLGDDEAALDTIPPYERPIVSDRVTQSFERDELDPAFERWRSARRDDADDARRMLRRERDTR